MRFVSLVRRLFQQLLSKVKTLFSFKKQKPAVVVVQQGFVEPRSEIDYQYTDREIFMFSLYGPNSEIGLAEFTGIIDKFKVIVSDSNYRDVHFMMSEMFKIKNIWIYDRSSFNLERLERACEAFKKSVEALECPGHMEARRLANRLKCIVLFAHQKKTFSKKDGSTWDHLLFKWNLVAA